MTWQQKKIENIRKSMTGYIWGEKLTPYATDCEIEEIVKLKDRLAQLHNFAFDRSKRGKDYQELPF